MGPAIKLSTKKSQASCCSVDRIVGRPLQRNLNRRATILSTLQQEAWDFANSLMALRQTPLYKIATSVLYLCKTMSRSQVTIMPTPLVKECMQGYN